MIAALIPWPGFDPDRPSRVAAACRHIGELLADGEWHSWKGVVTLVADDHELKPATVSNLLYAIVKVGGIERRGRYRRRADDRTIRLTPRDDQEAA